MNIQEFDYSVDLLQSLIWQQNNAVNFEKLLALKQQWYNNYQSQFWRDWYRDVFDLRTANDFGLAVWSIILGLPLFIDLLPNDRTTWGFQGGYHTNFDNGNFANYSNNIVLSTEDKRIVLRLRYFQLTTRCAVPGINEFLKYLFQDRGVIYCYDGLDMTMRYTYFFEMSFELLEALKQYDLLPRPEGVLLKLIDGRYPSWGFQGGYHKNFDNGNFYPET